MKNFVVFVFHDIVFFKEFLYFIIFNTFFWYTTSIWRQYMNIARRTKG